jgi:hypothetical protein
MRIVGTSFSGRSQESDFYSNNSRNKGRGARTSLTHLTFLERLKCKFKSENNGRRRVNVCSLTRNISRVVECVGVPRWGLGRVTRGLIIHIDLHKPNNTLVSV